MKKYLMVTLGSLICAISFNVFMVPFNIMPGGISGISIVINKYFHIEKALFILITSIALLLVSLITLGKKVTIKSLIGSILFPIFVYIVEILLKYYPINIDNIILAIVFGGVSFGFGLGLVYREGYTTGGTNIINQIISKYGHTSMGMGLFITEGIIVLVGGFVFGINIMMYSIMILYLSSIVIDRVMLGISSKKSFYIVTSKPNEVSNYIMKELNHGVTFLKGQGAYSKEEKPLLLTVIPTSDYYRLKEYLRVNDKEAFFVVNDSYEVSGGE